MVDRPRRFDYRIEKSILLKKKKKDGFVILLVLANILNYGFNPLFLLFTQIRNYLFRSLTLVSAKKKADVAVQ